MEKATPLRRRFALAVGVILGAASAAGCSWLGHRVGDLGDIVSVGVSTGGGVAVTVQPTRLLALEVGGRKDEVLHGWRRREFRWVESSWGLPFSFFWDSRIGSEALEEWTWSNVARTSQAKRAFLEPGTEGPLGEVVGEERIYHVFVLTGAENTRWTDQFDLEIGVTALLVGARLAISPGELVDFLAGLASLDPAGDDAEPREGVEEPPSEDPSSS